MEPASLTSHAIARALGRADASSPVNFVLRASSATAWPSVANLRANAAPLPGPTPTTTQTGFAIRFASADGAMLHQAAHAARPSAARSSGEDVRVRPTPKPA